MCGQYYIEERFVERLQELLPGLLPIPEDTTAAVNAGDVHPADAALILTASASAGDARPVPLQAQLLRWGFPLATRRTAGSRESTDRSVTDGQADRGLAARRTDRGLASGQNHRGFTTEQNDRSRSAAEKLVINARAETAASRPMFRESLRQRRCIVPASRFYEWDAAKNKVTFWLPENPVLFLAGLYRAGRFVILTTEANDSVRPVHDRMPLHIPPHSLNDWLRSAEAADSLLRRPQPQLRHAQEEEQLSLF
ncbi:MAG: SOS response-associated peptidase [Anaerovoracaceae bacterium]